MMTSVKVMPRQRQFCGIKSQNLPTIGFLLIAFVFGSIFNDFIRTHNEIIIPAQTYCNKPSIYDDYLKPSKSEEERFQELYAAAKVLDSEYTFDWTHGLAHELSILNTRKFYTKPRPWTCDFCNKMEAALLLAPEGLCSNGEKIDLLVQITTVPQEIDGRMAVRDTWGSLTRGNTASVRYMFLFGTGYSQEDQDIVNEEHEIYNDVLQHDYRDSYFNLTYKVIIGYTWAAQHCSRAQFILRTATDNFINLPALETFLDGHKRYPQRVQIGRVHPAMPRFKYRDSKFYVPDIEYQHNIYPPFAIGSAFIFPKQSIKDILEAAPHIPYFALEDVWFGMLMREIGIIPVNSDGFDVTPELEELEKIPSGTCPKNGSFYALHFQMPHMIGNKEADPYQFLYWTWASCTKYNVSRQIR